VRVGVSAVGEWMHDDRVVVCARRLHVGGRVSRDLAVRAHQIHAGALRLSATHARRDATQLPSIYRVRQKSGPQTHGHNSVKSEPI